MFYTLKQCWYFNMLKCPVFEFCVWILNVAFTESVLEIKE